MGRFVNLAGQKFGRLTAIAFTGGRNSAGQRMWRCRCECGNKIVTCGAGLVIGHARSCGCLQREHIKRLGLKCIKHGHTRGGKDSPTYISWCHMIQRCEDPKYIEWYLYGGRGIKVCDRWRGSFQAFLEDMGPRPNGKTLDRWPNKDGGYEPRNCRWATPKEQSANSRRWVHGASNCKQREVVSNP
jgi:hypothetical protein